MRMIHTIATLTIALVVAATAQANTLGAKQDTRRIADEFMKKIQTGDFDAAFGGIKIFFPIPEDEFNNLVTQTKNQFQMVKNRFGTTIGYELFKEESIKDLMVKYTYIMKFEKHIIRWMFIFYKPTQGWLLNWFHWDDKIDALFNEPLENNKK
ncbi:MAG TPA: hypothetical protein PL088_01245 [Spirochaetota bacterium]|nr:hypothetical protein [Spirochaetota bacterium]